MIIVPVSSWRDQERWQSLRDGSTCWTCADGPGGILIAESPAAWVTTRVDVPCRGYLCIYARRHVVEPYELPRDEFEDFFATVAAAARAINEAVTPVKMNYEIHGNTNPHLHLHVFPRYVGDPFEGGPIRASELHAAHSEEDIARFADAIGKALAR
jgi:diadenosine tetraphosphate (Ap4A) HIT family hydrolase